MHSDRFPDGKVTHIQWGCKKSLKIKAVSFKTEAHRLFMGIFNCLRRFWLGLFLFPIMMLHFTMLQFVKGKDLYRKNHFLLLIYFLHST